MIQTSYEFSKIAQGAIRPLDWGLNVSLTKNKDSQKTWFTLNQSELNGNDILSQPENQPIQLWDYYDYETMRDRVISMDIERSVEFPYNVQSAFLDVTLDNHDGALSVGENPYMLPKRPLRAYLGFADAGVIPQFVGLTQDMPKYSGLHDNTLTWTANDFLNDIGNKQLGGSVILENVTTGEAIAKVLDLYGMEPSMYDIAPGLNTIPFVYFDNDKNAGNALRELVEAEGGRLWLSETGVIKFEDGAADLDEQAVALFDETNITGYKPSQTDNIVNHVKIKSEVRQVTESKAIYDFKNEFYAEDMQDILKDPYHIDADGGQLTVWVEFENPVLDLDTNMILNGTTGSSFTAKFPGGASVSAGISAEVTPFAKSAKIVFTNNYAASAVVRIYEIKLFGRPAEIVDTIDLDVTDPISIEKFGDKTLEINNNFFGSRGNAERFAQRILERRADYSPIVEITAKCNPALELGDKVELNYEANGLYKVVGIKNRLSQKGLTQTLTLEKTQYLRSFTLNISALNSQVDRLA